LPAVVEPARLTAALRRGGVLDAGAVVTFGTGWMDRGSPIDGIYAAVTRRTLDGLHPQGWVPRQRLTVEEALRAYTTAAAYAGFDEERTGVGRDEFLSLLQAENVGSGVHYLSIAEHPFYQSLGWNPNDWPNALRIGRQTVSLPISAGMTQGDVTDVVRAVHRVLGKHN